MTSSLSKKQIIELLPHSEPMWLIDELYDIKKLFSAIQRNPSKYINVSKYDKSNIARSICDFIAGMTDRYAINLYKKIKWIYLKTIYQK